MSKADTCVLCGEIIPEGRQVCPLCAKEGPMGSKNNPYFNSEGYADPTAYRAMKTIQQKENAALDGKVNSHIKAIKFVATEAGFEITNRIERRNRKTGREFR